jgi:hypothetical protein
MLQEGGCRPAPEHPTKLGHKDLADDSKSLEKAMEIDVSKLPKQQ